MRSVTFEIEGTHCDGCARTIPEPGVRASTIPFNDGGARVLYAPMAAKEDCLISAPGCHSAGPTP